MRSICLSLAAAFACAVAAAPALANTPEPIASGTKVDQVVVNSNGSRTVTVQGTWNWTTQQNCPTSRDGVGYQVAWFDGNTANPIGQQQLAQGIIYVGGSTDDIVHSIDVLGGSRTSARRRTTVSRRATCHTTASSSAPTQDRRPELGLATATTSTRRRRSRAARGARSRTLPSSFKGQDPVLPGAVRPAGGPTTVARSAQGRRHHRRRQRPNNDNSYSSAAERTDKRLPSHGDHSTEGPHLRRLRG